jgi:2-dehydropantoate 2-reductase
MKVSVIGAGALGSLLGGLLQFRAAEHDILLIGRGPHGAALRQRGRLTLVGPWGKREVRVRFSESVADAAGSGIVLFTVKSHATAQALLAFRPYLGDAVLVSIQNGINARLLDHLVPPGQMVAGIYAGNVAVVEPGVVSQQLDGAVLLGPPAPGRLTSAVERAAAVLARTGLRVHAHPNVRGAQYNKLAVNALGYASVLSGSNIVTDGLLCRAWRQSVGGPILAECARVFREAGIALVPIPGVPDVGSFRFLLFLFGVPFVGDIGGLIMRFCFDRKPIIFSLQKDLERQKTTEIDFVNGEIVRVARELGMQAPCNALVVEMVHELEQRGDGSFFSRDEVVRRFHARSQPLAVPR